MGKIFTEKEICIATYKVLDEFCKKEAKTSAKQDNPIKGLIEGIKNTAIRVEVANEICNELGIDFKPEELEKEIG